jgi:transposase-like protein
MDDRARRFQQAALEHNGGRSGRGIRYTKDLRREAVAYARSNQAKGYRLSKIADDLGLKSVTLARWMKQSQGSALRPVEILATPGAAETAATSTSVVMTLPNGIRIEGLAVDSLVSLLRQIG